MCVASWPTIVLTGIYPRAHKSAKWNKTQSHLCLKRQQIRILQDEDKENCLIGAERQDLSIQNYTINSDIIVEVHWIDYV